ncbi:DUF6531 domain-containing protein [Streptomyces sp. NPDC006129]|uniref:DUF6531 domain-containing protein n=1 Tax=unclassified Streptomyces TaxID=2593676 RepID=UPI0033ABAEC9
MATGMFFEQLTDAQLVGVGEQVTLERTYRPDSTATGLLGRGWATPFDVKLTVASGKVTYQADDGAKFVFTQKSDGTYTAPAGSAAKLVKGTSTYTVTTPDHTKRTFSSTGQLTSVVNGGGQSPDADVHGDRRTKPRSRSSTREGSPPEMPKASTPSVTAKRGATARTTN